MFVSTVIMSDNICHLFSLIKKVAVFLVKMFSWYNYSYSIIKSAGTDIDGLISGVLIHANLIK